VRLQRQAAGVPAGDAGTSVGAARGPCPARSACVRRTMVGSRFHARQMSLAAPSFIVDAQGFVSFWFVLWGSTSLASDFVCFPCLCGICSASCLSLALTLSQ